jgi:4-amino-4-deoxy-L-arabinose transferase-like glycosyltransferase
MLSPPVGRRHAHIAALLGLLAACGLLFFHRLADRDLWSSHEARAGMDAQTVLDGGRPGLPHLFDGRPDLQKPPLYYWLVAGLAWLRGTEVDALAVRLPAAMSALACVLAVWLGLGVLRRRPAAALACGTVLATAAHFVWLARIGRIDMPLTLTVTAAAGCLYLARKRSARQLRAWPLLLAGYVAIAVGVLLKGPIGAVLPAAILAAHLVVEGDWRPRRWRLGLVWGVPLVLALTVPWFVWADRATGGEFTRVFFWHHNLGRGLGGSGLRHNPWWFYAPQFLGDFLPWSVLVPLAAWQCRRRPLLRRDPDARFSCTWFLAVLFVLSCSRFKRADYLLPAYPGAALFLGCVLHRHLRALSRTRLHFAVAFLPAVAGATVVAWLIRIEYLLPAQESFRDYRVFAGVIRRQAPQPQEVLFFRTEAHALAFRLGRPLAVFVQWEKFRARVVQPGTHFVVMPPECLDECPHHLGGVRLHEVLRNTDLSGGRHERPLVLLRAGPATEFREESSVSPPHARTAEVAADRLRTAQRGTAGP